MEHRRGMARASWMAQGVASTVALAIACGGSREPARAPEAEPASEDAYGQQAPADTAGEAEEGAAPPAAAPEPGGGLAPATAPAPGRAMPGTTGPRSDAAGGGGELVELSDELDRALALQTPDCTTAGFLRDRICELSEALCRLSGDQPEDAALRGRCDDGRARCERARQRVGASCQ